MKATYDWLNQWNQAVAGELDQIRDEQRALANRRPRDRKREKARREARRLFQEHELEMALRPAWA
jgi:hypothetical protein